MHVFPTAQPCQTSALQCRQVKPAPKFGQYIVMNLPYNASQKGINDIFRDIRETMGVEAGKPLDYGSKRYAVAYVPKDNPFTKPFGRPDRILLAVDPIGLSLTDHAVTFRDYVMDAANDLLDMKDAVTRRYPLSQVNNDYYARSLDAPTQYLRNPSITFPPELRQNMDFPGEAKRMQALVKQTGKLPEGQKPFAITAYGQEAFLVYRDEKHKPGEAVDLNEVREITTRPVQTKQGITFDNPSPIALLPANELDKALRALEREELPLGVHTTIHGPRALFIIPPSHPEQPYQLGIATFHGKNRTADDSKREGDLVRRFWRIIKDAVPSSRALWPERERFYLSGESHVETLYIDSRINADSSEEIAERLTQKRLGTSELQALILLRGKYKDRNPFVVSNYLFQPFCVGDKDTGKASGETDITGRYSYDSKQEKALYGKTLP